MNTSFAPLPARDFDHAAARHLLWRAGFGGTPAQIRQLVDLGLNAAVDHLVDYPAVDPTGPEDLDPDVIRVRTDEERKRIARARRDGDQEILDAQRKVQLEARQADRKMFQNLQRWWVRRMITTAHAFEEQLTFFWHGHFASSNRSVRDTYLMYAQNVTLRENARGPFADLVTAIVHDPAMLKYLNNDQNRKGRPNENLARELMELFTLGVGNYTEADIKEVARALTGHAVKDNDYQFRANQHDTGVKKILGKTGPFDGDTVAQLLATRPACAPFIALKLYDHFVADVGDVDAQVPASHRAGVDAFARVFREEKLKTGPALKRLFKSRHFYDPAIVGRKIKNPVQLVVGTVRSLNTPVREQAVVLSALGQMGQLPFEPPTVDGWNGGRAWINTSTLFVRQNYATYLATGDSGLLGGKRKKNRKKSAPETYRPTALLNGLNISTPRAAADALIDHALGPQVPADRRAPLYTLADKLMGRGVGRGVGVKAPAAFRTNRSAASSPPWSPPPNTNSADRRTVQRASRPLPQPRRPPHPRAGPTPMCDHYHPQSCNTPDPRLYAEGGFTRRGFLRQGVGLVSAAATVPAFLLRAGDALAADTTMRLSSTPGAVDERVLVVVQLSGGNDGLNTVIPFGDDAYYQARPQLAHDAKEALALPGVNGIGLHPELGGIQELVQADLAGIVQAVGYPNPNRSHFTSMDIWNTADPSGQGGRGWIGQALDPTATAIDPARGGLDCLSIGKGAPLAALGQHVRAVNFEKAELFRYAGRDLGKAMAETYDAVQHVPPHADANDDPLAFVNRTALDAQVASTRVRKAVAGKSETKWPKNGLANQLQMVARMIRADLPTRVYYVTMGGFDTHANEKPTHARLMRAFSSAMKAFYDELDATGDRGRVVSLAFSEFGRRVRQNASGGTDHGTAGPSFVFGEAVNSGLIGQNPSLTRLDKGDLIHQVDFRSIYRDLLQDWMKLDPTVALGGKHKSAGILQAV